MNRNYLCSKHNCQMYESRDFTRDYKGAMCVAQRFRKINEANCFSYFRIKLKRWRVSVGEASMALVFVEISVMI